VRIKHDKGASSATNSLLSGARRLSHFMANIRPSFRRQKGLLVTHTHIVGQTTMICYLSKARQINLYANQRWIHHSESTQKKNVHRFFNVISKRPTDQSRLPVPKPPKFSRPQQQSGSRSNPERHHTGRSLWDFPLIEKSTMAESKRNSSEKAQTMRTKAFYISL